MTEPFDPTKLSNDTVALLNVFRNDFERKMIQSQVKYGYADTYLKDGIVPYLQTSLREHMVKGDPLDVAILCFMLWVHSAPTLAGKNPESPYLSPVEAERMGGDLT